MYDDARASGELGVESHMGLWSQGERVERLFVALLRGTGDARAALAMYCAW